jgi:hypothetical protein
MGIWTPSLSLENRISSSREDFQQKVEKCLVFGLGMVEHGRLLQTEHAPRMLPDDVDKTSFQPFECLDLLRIQPNVLIPNVAK